MKLLDKALKQDSPRNVIDKIIGRYSPSRAKECKDNEVWKECLSWRNGHKCLKSCILHDINFVD